MSNVILMRFTVMKRITRYTGVISKFKVTVAPLRAMCIGGNDMVSLNCLVVIAHVSRDLHLLQKFVNMFKLDLSLEFLTLWGLIFVGFIALLYMFWDVNYFLRIIYTIGWARMFKGQIDLDETTEIYGKITLIFTNVFNIRTSNIF